MLFLRSAVATKSLSQCLSANTHQVITKRSFQAAHRLFSNSSGIQDHYATLELPHTASAAEIKKQFYRLSKSHHPDLHPSDPSAVQQFVKISEAYATLGSSEKRERYDREFLRSALMPGSTDSARRASYSSASTGPGSRPASGLSRRRTQFHDPPPSFYRNGGWGQHSDKRGEHASKASHSYEAQGRSASGPAGPGMGPGGFTPGHDNDVPHFDQRAHAQTHEDIERNKHRARRQDPNSRLREETQEGGGTSTILQFFLLSGLLTSVVTIPALLNGSIVMSHTEAKKGSSEG